MSLRTLSVHSFYRTGQDDCANVFDKDEVREALRTHPGHTDRQLLDDILRETYGLAEPETKERWLREQDFEGLNPERCWDAYQRGWGDRALAYIKGWRRELEGEMARNPKDATMTRSNSHGSLKTFTVVRVNRSDADTYAVEGDGEFARARALKLAAPDPGDQIQYAVVQARDAGAARLQGRSWRPFPAGEGEPVANPRDPMLDAILKGMAGALWVTSWASYCDELSPARRQKLREEGLIPGPGGDWADAAPESPPQARSRARALIQAFEELNGVPMTTLFARALQADQRTASTKLADLFGHYLAMQAMGHGVSWFDDHARFPLVFPFACEAYYDGRRLEVSMRVQPGRKV